MSSSEAQSLDRHKFSVLSRQSSVTTGGKAIADSGQLVPNPQPRTPALPARIQVHVFEFVIEGKGHGQKNAYRGCRLSLPATENSFSGISALKHARLT